MTMLSAMSLVAVQPAMADTYTLNPIAEVAFRTNTGWNGTDETAPTAWQTGFPKTNQETIECTYSQRMWAQEMFDVTDVGLSNASEVTLTLINANSSTYRLGAWVVPNADWTSAEAQTWTDGTCPVVEAFKSVVGVYPSYQTSSKTYLAYASADDVTKTQLITFSGDALTTLKNGVVEKDGKQYLSLIITFRETDASYSTGRNPKYYGVGSSVETNRPVLTVTKNTPAVVNNTTGTGYETLAAAVADIATVTEDNNNSVVLTLNKDVEISSRLNIKTQNVTIQGATGEERILRASSYVNGLMFLTQDTLATLTMENLVIDGQGVEASAAVFEASNKGLTVLNNVTIKDAVTTSTQGIFCNKNNGRAVLNGVTITGSTASASKALVFVGTSKMTLSGNNNFGAVYVEKDNYLTDEGATAQQVVIVDNTRTPNIVLVKGGTLANYTVSGQAEGLSLVQNGNDLYLSAETTAIHTVSETATVAEGNVYNLAGQMVGSACKGVVIKNGKKYIQR